ncbi:MAG: PEP-CTERM sorting domain-containing protein [Planctomycetota bacterium]
MEKTDAKPRTSALTRAAVAVTGGAATAAGVSANAAIVTEELFFKLEDNGIQIDFDNNGTSEFQFIHTFDDNPLVGASSTDVNGVVQILAGTGFSNAQVVNRSEENTGLEEQDLKAGNPPPFADAREVLPLVVGDTVGPDFTFRDVSTLAITGDQTGYIVGRASQGTFSDFEDGVGYLGVSFELAGETHYGFFSIGFVETVPPFTGGGATVGEINQYTASLVGFAWETTPNTPITIFAIPEPGTFTLFALAAGLLGRRPGARRRRSAA